MINVLHIINGADLGGISSLLLNYYSHIDRDKFHFDFIYSMDEPLGYNGIKLKELGANFYYVPLKSKYPIKHAQQISAQILKGAYDIVHVHSSYTSWYVLRIAYKNGVKQRFAHAHNAIYDKLPFIEEIKHITGVKLIKKYATRRIACSKEAAAFTFDELPTTLNNVEILPNAIDVRKFAFNEEMRREVRKEMGITLSQTVIGTVGRMSPEKNQIKLIESFKCILNQKSDAILVLIGDGDTKYYLEEQILKLNIQDNVIFMGKRSDIYRLLNGLDVFTLPSLYEGFPISAIEALSNGLPIVLSDTITDELKRFKNVQYISLKNENEIWGKVLLKQAELRNKNYKENKKILMDEYDIFSASKLLEKLYEDDK